MSNLAAEATELMSVAATALSPRLMLISWRPVHIPYFEWVLHERWLLVHPSGSDESLALARIYYEIAMPAAQELGWLLPFVANHRHFVFLSL